MVIFSIFYWAFFCLSLPFFFVGLTVVHLLTLPFDRNGALSHRYTSWWGMFYIWANPIWRVTITGRSRIPEGPAVMIANHASHLDILVLFGLFRNFKWVSKMSNFKIPVIGWTMKINRYPGVVRGDRASVEKMMEECRSWLRRGVPILIFPEGTRSQDGSLRRFKDGAFQLALEMGCPIVPIAIKGTAEVLPKSGWILQGPMDAYVDVLDPIPSDGYELVEALREAARRELAGALEAA